MDDLTTLPGLTDRQREIARDVEAMLPAARKLRMADQYEDCAELLRDLSQLAARAEAAERERDAAVGLLHDVLAHADIYSHSETLRKIEQFVTAPAAATRHVRAAALEELYAALVAQPRQIFAGFDAKTTVEERYQSQCRIEAAFAAVRATDSGEREE